jgi:hypothetical protein
VDIARSEAVEADLDRLIERRSRKGEVDPDEQEELRPEELGAERPQGQSWRPFAYSSSAGESPSGAV